MKLTLVLSSVICAISVSASGIYNVRDFGAKGDGVTDSSISNVDAPVEPGVDKVVMFRCGDVRISDN